MKVNINRQLAGLEDIAFGTGTVMQERQGELVEITKVNLGNLPFDETLSAAEVLTPIYEQIVPNIAEILLADENAAIATTKAAEASDSAAAALASEQAAAASEGAVVTNAGIATTKAAEASDSAAAALASEQAATANAAEAAANADIATTKAAEAADSAAAASVSEQVAVSEGLIATTNAGVATTKASEALASANAALLSEQNALASEQAAAASALEATTLIDDTIPKLDRTYSSSNTQLLHDAQAEAIANLSGASASFYNNTTQVIPESPTAFANLTWTNSQASTNNDMFELGTNEVSFKVDGNYSFLNTLTFYRISDGSTMNVTFEMYDADTTATLGSVVVPIDMTAGTKETVPLNAVIPISGASISNPVRMQVRMQATSANGTIELFGFNSIVVAQTISSGNTVQKDSSTGAAYIPSGTTAQRPVAPASGYLRYNTDLNSMEAYANGTWGSVGGGGGATGGGSDQVFVETSYTVTQDYTLTAGKSAITVGDAYGNVTIVDGKFVEVLDGSLWVIEGN